MAQQGEGTALTTVDHVNLMEKYGIEFEGRIIPEEWGDYREIFQEIRRIGQTNPDEYYAKFQSNDSFVIQMKEEVSALIKNAWTCLRTRASEDRWRLLVEKEPLKLFDEELICHLCFKRRWIPKFEARPVDQVEAERLERRRARRTPCRCTRERRAEIQAKDHASQLFHVEMNKKSIHESITEQEKKNLTSRKPDGVIGLALTETLELLRWRLSKSFCPYKDINMMYPFMVVEVKSADNTTATFGSILRQMAFVIRTCIKLQQNLQEETQMPHQCLVWSLAIMGEEWRLYGAVPRGNGVQIFDLWHGTVLFPEGALQLLLLLDYLCDWACEIYRMNVLECLAGGRANLNELRATPFTDTSSQVTDIELRDMRNASIVLRPPIIPQPEDTSALRQRRATSQEFLGIGTSVRPEAMEFSIQETPHNWRKWETRELDHAPWTKTATIRHSNEVELRMLQVALPDQTDVLRSCLESLFPDLRIESAALKLFLTLDDDSITFSWYGNLPKRQVARRALAFFQSALNPSNWQITRQLLLVTWTYEAGTCLAQIAGLPVQRVRPVTYNEPVPYQYYVDAMSWPRLVGGASSAGLALSKAPMCLRVVSGESRTHGCTWVRYDPQGEDSFRAYELGGIMSECLKTPGVTVPEALKVCVEFKSNLYTVDALESAAVSSDMNKSLSKLRGRGLVIRRPESWPWTTQEYCLLVLDEDVTFNNEHDLAQLLEEVKTHGALYLGTSGDRHRGNANSIIDKWIKILKGGIPSDAALDSFSGS